MGKWSAALAAFFLSTLLALSGAISLVFPRPVRAFTVPSYSGLVNDYAQILSDQTEANLEYQLGSMAQSTSGAQLAVVTISSLEGDTIENVAQEFFESWGIGKKTKDNGVLLLVAVDDRQVRIHTGYGAETVITDSTAGQIIRTDITPWFKDGNYEAGIQNGVASLTRYLEDPSQIPDTAAAEQDNSPFSAIWVVVALYLFFIFGVGGLTYGAAFLGRSKSWWPGGALGFVLGLIVGQLPGALAGGLFGLLLDYILSKNYARWKLEKRTTDWRQTWGGFRSSGSSSSSSSSGFSSFGGGSSGGGGASGRW